MGIIESFGSTLEKVSDGLKDNRITNFKKTFLHSLSLEKIEPRHISTINESLEGQKIKDIPYTKRVFVLNGEKVEGVFPEFNSKFDVKLPENLYKASDNEQMKYCTKELGKKIDSNSELGEKFTARQLEQIRNNEPRISGLTWHHTEIPGKMQLVDAVDHSTARHTGGRSVWGGGSENR